MCSEEKIRHTEKILSLFVFCAATSIAGIPKLEIKRNSQLCTAVLYSQAVLAAIIVLFFVTVKSGVFCFEYDAYFMRVFVGLF